MTSPADGGSGFKRRHTTHDTNQKYPCLLMRSVIAKQGKEGKCEDMDRELMSFPTAHEIGTPQVRSTRMVEVTMNLAGKKRAGRLTVPKEMDYNPLIASDSWTPMKAESATVMLNGQIGLDCVYRSDDDGGSSCAIIDR
jgi:hypothetical protein